MHALRSFAVTLLVACEAESPAVRDTSDTAWSVPDSATWIADTGRPPWPDGDTTQVGAPSLVVEGNLVTSGARLTLTSAPARTDAGRTLAVVVVNRTAEALELSEDPSVWIDAEGWTLLGAPPSRLDPGASATFALRYTPLAETGARTREDLLRVPGTAMAITLEVTVPRPNRALVTGDGGYLAWSDNDGETWSDTGPPASLDLRDRGVVWGEGRFFRAWATGQGWFEEGRYAWSVEGADWSTTTVADEFWPSECTWGMERFACARGDALTWSESGATAIHEATHWEAMLNTVTWTGEAFLAAGRSGRRVLSHDGASWDVDATGALTDEWFDAACHGDTCVLVGGTNRYAIATSLDGGRTWNDQTFGESAYARLHGVLWDGAEWLVYGLSNTSPQMYHSADGLTWSSYPELTRSTVYSLLGAQNGWRFAVRDRQLFRSRDGIVWDASLTPPTGVSLRSFAAEAR